MRRTEKETESRQWHAPSTPAPHAANSAADTPAGRHVRARFRRAGGRQPGSGRPGRADGRPRRGHRHRDRPTRRDHRGRRPAGPGRAREGRDGHPRQGRAARHPRHLEARPRPQRRPAGRRASPRGHGRHRPGRPDSPSAVPDDGTAAGAEASAAPDPAVTAEAAATAQAVAQAAGAAGKALAAGDLPAALAALEAAREQAAQGRRVLKAAASGRRAPATRPGALRDLVEAHLRQFPDAAFTPHQIGKVLTRSSGAVANALDKLVSLGVAELASGKPRSYRLAPAAPAPPDDGNPGSAQATPSAA